MRYISAHVVKDLSKKMVWVGGPRQCGKTHLANAILASHFKNGEYLNWDRDKDRLKILKEEWNPSSDLIVFDEIHKYSKWKSLLKGYYDVFKDQHRFLVTGSSRLDTFKKGGDSLLGRYHYWRLHPFTISESINKIKPDESLRRLLTFGGFPEPFLDGNEIESQRWRQDRLDRIVKDDIRDIENIKDIESMKILLDMLRDRVGGPIVVSNLAEDLKKSPITISKWIELFEKMYLIFKIYPHSKNVARSLEKPAKIYFFDNADVTNGEGARFENLVATHILKKLHFDNDRLGRKLELKYIRDKEKREVDFAIVEGQKLLSLIEVKLSDEKASQSLVHFSEKLKPHSASQIVLNLKRSYRVNSLDVTQALESPWLTDLEFKI